MNVHVFARKEIANIQSTDQNSAILDQNLGTLDNWFLTTCLTTRPQGATAPIDGVFTSTFWLLAALLVLLFWRVPSV